MLPDRRRPRRRALLSLILVVAAVGSASVSRPSPVAAGAADAMKTTVAAWINADRVAHGLAPLAVDVRVDTLAGYRATVLAEMNVLSHSAPGSLSTQLQGAGVDYRSYGEAIGWTSAPFGDAAATWLYDGWKKSAPHWAILMGAGYTHVGIGFAVNPATGRTYGVIIAVELDPPSDVGRLAGSDRFATAAAVSAATFAPGVPVAYVAYAFNYPDALAAAAASGTVQGPILLAATSGALHPSTAAELTRLRPGRIVVLGSPGVVSDAVLAALAGYADSGQVSRVAGADRFATAAAVSAATFAPGVPVAYIAYAFNYPDALAGAAASGVSGGPVLLAATTGPLDPATAAELARLRPGRIVVLGSAGVIADEVLGRLAPYATSGKVSRLAGADRFATAAALSAATFQPGVDVAYIAYAFNYPDALAGAAASGTVNGPVLLSATSGPLHPATAAELARLRPGRIVVLGSRGVISDGVVAQLEAYATGS